jgi:hypothetical protein
VCSSRALPNRKYCEAHKDRSDDERTSQERDRLRADDPIRRLYLRKRWVKGTRIAVLLRDPLCVMCGHRASDTADHYPLSAREIVAMLGENEFYDADRCRGLCASCHSTTTHATGERGLEP